MFHALQRINLSALVVLLVLVLATRSVNPFKGKKKAVSGGDAAGELMSRQLEFILSTEFPVIDSEQCEKRCWDIMEKYKEARSEIKAGPFAHDRCNLGWMYFGWRFSLDNLPFDVRLFSNQTKALVGELQQMNEQAGIRPSEPSSVHGKGKEPMQSELIPRFENKTLSVYIDQLWDRIDRAVDWARSKTPVHSLPEPGNFPAIEPAIGYCSALLLASTASCSTGSSSQANLLPLKYLLTAITAQFWRASDLGKARREEARQAAAEEKKDRKRAGAKKGSKPAKEDPRMCTCDIGIVVEDAYVNEADCDPLMFAERFTSGIPQYALMWLKTRGAGDRGVDAHAPKKYDISKHPGPVQVIKQQSRREASMKVRMEDFELFMAQSFGGLWSKPFPKSTPPVSDFELRYYQGRTYTIIWTRREPRGFSARVENNLIGSLTYLEEHVHTKERGPPPAGFR